MADEVKVVDPINAVADANGASKVPEPAPNRAPPPKGDNEVHGEPLPKDKKPKEEPKPKDAPKPKEEEDKTDAEDENEEDEVEEKDWTKEYVQFDDPAGQSVVELLKEAGVKPVEANSFFKEATETGDLSKVKWDLIEARLGKAKTALAKIGIEQYYNNVWKVQKETQDKAYETVGGEQNWKKLAKWVQKTEKADPSKKAEFDNLRKAIDVGGATAQYAVNKFKELYEADGKNSGLKSNARDLVRGDQNGRPVGSPTTRAENLAELKKAHDRRASPQEIAAIRARRAAGRAAGI